MPNNFWTSLKSLHFALSPRMVLPIAFGLGAAAILLAVRGIFFQFAAKSSREKKTELTLLSVLRAPSIYWCIAIGLYVTIAFSDLEGQYTRQLYQFVHVILVLSVTLAAANVSAALFRNVMEVADQGARTSGLALGVVKGIVISLGILVVLSMLGISIAPILTALGVGGLAVALALRDTLENLFAGLYLITDRAIRVGDFIKLEGGQEGTVEDIGWRTIRIRTLGNNIVILPNSKLAQSIVVNYSLPDPKLSVSIPVVTAMEANIPQVEELVLSVAKKGTEDIVGLLAWPEPSVRFNPGVGDDSLGFSLNVHVEEYAKQFFVQHELKRRIYQRFVEEKIPFPTRALRITRDSALTV